MVHEPGAIVAPGFRSLVLSHKSRNEVLGSAAKTTKFISIGGAAALLVGSVTGILMPKAPKAVAAIAGPSKQTVEVAQGLPRAQRPRDARLRVARPA